MRFIYLYIMLLMASLFYVEISCFNKKDSTRMSTEKKEFEIPPTEDLMREHGVLNRILLIYEEIIERINHNTFPQEELAQAVAIIKEFIQNYHEKLEENYLFPLFEKAKKEIRLVKTLRNQHNKGREITSRLLDITQLKNKHDSKIKREIKSLLKKFVRMYRPHEAREDTVLFPKVRSLISENQFKELGEKFEALEHELFGEKGFENIVKKVEAIEKNLGIYRLEQFTPDLKK